MPMILTKIASAFLLPYSLSRLHLFLTIFRQFLTWPPRRMTADLETNDHDDEGDHHDDGVTTLETQLALPRMLLHHLIFNIFHNFFTIIMLKGFLRYCFSIMCHLK